MNIYRFNEVELTRAYGILCASLPSGAERDALYPTFCKIEAHGKTTSHAHFETELFFIIAGQGEIEIDRERESVSAGDLIRIPPFAEHILHNSSSEELTFLSVYGEDSQILRGPQNVRVTAAPPTPNGSLHLGHISGPYLAADVMARYLSQRGVHVDSHSGTDDHQNYVGEKAKSLGTDAELFRQAMRQRILKSLRAMNIQFNEFIEPKTDVNYQKEVLRFAQLALEKGVLDKESLALPHCDHCEQILIDARVEGQCPSCHESSRGGCEACGLVVLPNQLQKPSCSICHRPAKLKTVEVYTFPLGQYLASLELETLELPPRLQKLVQQVKAQPDCKVLVTYPGSEGLRLPGTQQTLHVWFEMAAHYATFATNSAYWIHSFGFDNAFYYLLFIPALLRAVYPEAKLPDAVLTNEFLLLEGLKFSTSRGHAVWADEFDGPVDVLRFYLCLQRPQVQTANFSVAEFEAFAKPFLQQIQSLFELPERTRGQASNHRALLECNRFIRDIEQFLAPNEFDPRRAARRTLEFIDLTLQREERLMVRTLAMTLAPFMPETSSELLARLGSESSAWITDSSRML